MRFLSVKTVPKLSWSAPYALTFKPPFLSMVYLVFGLVVFGLGEALIVAASIGVSPWVVFAQGITNVTGWSIGFATFITSLAVLVCWLPLKQMPGLGTVLNAILIALVLEYLLPYLPVFENIVIKIVYAVFGIMVAGVGAAIYLIANLGPGPRDGLMTGLQVKTNLPVAWVRTCLEIIVVTAGWLLGGSIGIGTILFAAFIGSAIAAGMHFLQYLFKERL